MVTWGPVRATLVSKHRLGAAGGLCGEGGPWIPEPRPSSGVEGQIGAEGQERTERPLLFVSALGCDHQHPGPLTLWDITVEMADVATTSSRMAVLDAL